MLLGSLVRLFINDDNTIYSMAPLLIIFLLHVSHFTIKFNGIMMSDNNNNNDGKKNDSKVSWLILSENIEKNVNRPSS